MTLRTGFLARTFLPFSTLVVSRGYGSPGDDTLIPLPAEPEATTIVGRPGLSVRGETRDAPHFTLKVEKKEG